jgi:hypothetical protein
MPRCQSRYSRGRAMLTGSEPHVTEQRRHTAGDAPLHWSLNTRTWSLVEFRDANSYTEC